MYGLGAESKAYRSMAFVFFCILPVASLRLYGPECGKYFLGALVLGEGLQRHGGASFSELESGGTQLFYTWLTSNVVRLLESYPRNALRRYPMRAAAHAGCAGELCTCAHSAGLELQGGGVCESGLLELVQAPWRASYIARAVYLMTRLQFA